MNANESPNPKPTATSALTPVGGREIGIVSRAVGARPGC